MKVASSDIAKVLLSELKAVREKHQQFQTRVKAADAAARTRDDGARKQNVILTKKISELENELKQAKESIEVLRQFTELLPTVKSEVDAFEDEVEAFEALGSNESGHNEAANASMRVQTLEKGVDEITRLCNLSEMDLSDLGTESDFSLVERSPGCSPLPQPDAMSNPKPSTSSPVSPTRKPAAEISDIPLLKTTPTAYVETPSPEPKPASVLSGWPAPLVISRQDFRAIAPSKTDDPRSNRERLEFVSKLMEQSLKLGDVWYSIPQLWFNDWKKLCQEYPDDIKTEVGQINMSSLSSGFFGSHNGWFGNHTGKVSIPAPAWHQLSEWYGSDGEDIQSVVMPQSPAGLPFIDNSPRRISIYFMLPPSRAQSSIIQGPYTPEAYISSKCSIRSLRSIIMDSLPANSGRRSIECFSSPSYPGSGWYVSHRIGLRMILPESQGDKVVDVARDTYVIVSIKVFDETKSSMVPIDPFPPPACPPRYMTWSPPRG